MTDWHTSILAQGALARFIDEGHFARHVRKMRAVYQHRHVVMLRSLALLFPRRLEVMPSVAGLHITALARSASVQEIDAVVCRAFEAGVAVRNLADFAVRARRAGLILGYGAIAANDIEEGLHQLRRCFR